MTSIVLNTACRHFRGSRPCMFNKLDGSECATCRHISEYRDRILFVKLDAIGDVLRTASVLPAIMARYDSPYIAWVTRRESVDLVDMLDHVDEVIEVSEIGLARVATGGWDEVFSLSNDVPSAAIATLGAGGRPIVGYGLARGVLEPSNSAARAWLEMAAFDRLKQANTRSYQRIMLDIIGYAGDFAPPALTIPPAIATSAAARIADLFPAGGRKRVAVNVGADRRWPKKMLDAKAIADFIARLRSRAALDVLLVGGAAETEKSAEVLALHGEDAHVRAALTPRSVPEFVATLAAADALLCGDTLALHVASAVGLPTVAIFGPTSLPEIADFGGLICKIATPLLSCLGCYGDCKKTQNCMSLLDIDRLVDAVLTQLGRRAS